MKPFNEQPVMIEADFLDTVASVKSRLLLDQPDRVPDSRIGLVYKWSQLEDGMTFDDEEVDVAVGCTIDLFIKEPEDSD